MKKTILIFAAFLVFSTLRANDAFKVTYNKVNSDEIHLMFELGDFKLMQTELNNQQFTRIVFDHSITTKRKGFAELPYLNASIELQNNKNVDIEVEAGEYTDYQLDSDLVPSRGIIYRNQDSEKIPYRIDPTSLTNDWYPRVLATSTEPYIIKDKRGINVFANPFVYNAKKKTLRVYKTLKVKLKENSTKSINPIANKTSEILPEMKAVYRSMFLNYYESSKDDLSINQYGDILVITTSRDEAAIQPYIDWKKEKGFNVELEVVSQGTNVKSLIQDKYNANNNLLYVVLVGDWEDIKSDVGPQSGPMDPQLGCVAGTDNVADITIGRISSNEAADVTVQVNKFIQYELSPETNADWYSATLGVASDEGGPSWGKGDDLEADTAHQRVIYEDKLNPFTFNQFYEAFDPGATVSDVSTAVEAGVSFINYTGHGSFESWGTSGFSNSNIANLTNGNKLPYIVSVACNNGDFHQGTCFAETWVRKENGGAISMVAASISQPWDPPMRGQDYMADIIIGGYDYDAHPGQSGINTNEQRTFLGSIVFNSLALMTAESNGTEDWETVKTWNIFGDPSLQIRTEAPSELNLSNNVILSNVPFETTITSGGNPVSGAQVCISKDGNYFSGITDATGFISIDHSLEPGTGKLTVTSFNSVTISEDVTIVPPNGAYIIVADHSINDAAANNNQLLDFDETAFLNVDAKNVGNNDATGVDATLSSTDTYITINDNSHSFGDIASNSTISGSDAFSITLADNVPDQHPIEFNIAFTDNTDETWTSSIFILANAPDISIGQITINDATTGNNNGILDPGETADLIIEIENIGHATSLAGNASIISSSTDITLNSTSQDITAVSPNETLTLSFSVTANANVNQGTHAQINCEINSGNYIFQKELDLIIGEVPEFLMTNGTFEVCVGKFMDSGGEDNDYELNENYVITFEPFEDNHIIKLDFVSFNIEQDYDFMYIYDGLDESATQIGEYTGSNSPGLVEATNADGALTVKFTSDYIQNAPGWVADISCSPVVGIEDSENENRSVIYPNPANSVVNISLMQTSKVKIFDLTNRIVLAKDLTEGLHKIDLNKLPSGTYIVNIANNKQNITQKLIVQ